MKEGRKGNRSGAALFVLCFVYSTAMLASGLSAMAPFGMALCALCAAGAFFRTVLNRGPSPYHTASCAYLFIETFVYFCVWGADEPGQILLRNGLLAGIPLLVLCLFPLTRKIRGEGARKGVRAAADALTAGLAVTYVFLMSLRAKPSMESLQNGHDAYLSSISPADLTENPPNVLIVLMDDMGWADISAYAGKAGESAISTPNIDALAEDGVLMENFYASAPVCSPSRFGLLTGRYAARGGLDNVVFPSVCGSRPYSITHFVNPFVFPRNVDGMLGDEITIAEVLRAAGYETACVGKWNLGDYGQYRPCSQGFDLFYGSYYVNDMTPYDWVEERNGETREVRTHAENLDQSESTRLFAAEADRFLTESVDKGKPFFLYYASPWPHYPIFSDRNGNGKGDLSDDVYTDCIEEFDDYLGRTIRLLKDRGVYDDTLIIFTSDNGPGREGVAGPLRGRKNTTFDGGMKVPLIAVYKNGGIPAGSRVSSPAMNTDLFPTVLSMAGIERLPADRVLDGRDLRALWRGELPPDAPVHDALFHVKGGRAQAVQMRAETADGEFDFKFYDRVPTENSAFPGQYYEDYLFNLDRDPAEGYNISPEEPETAERLRAELEDFRRSLKKNRRGKV